LAIPLQCVRKAIAAHRFGLRAVKCVAGGRPEGHEPDPAWRQLKESFMEIVLQPRTVAGPPCVADNRGWPAGYFEKSFGSITDESFLRPPPFQETP
jgi:hypothetical protein